MTPCKLLWRVGKWYGYAIRLLLGLILNYRMMQILHTACTWSTPFFQSSSPSPSPSLPSTSPPSPSPLLLSPPSGILLLDYSSISPCQLSAKPDQLPDGEQDQQCYSKPDLTSFISAHGPPLFPAMRNPSIPAYPDPLLPAKPVSPLPAKCDPPVPAYSKRSQIVREQIVSMSVQWDQAYQSCVSEARSKASCQLIANPDSLLPGKPYPPLSACSQWSQIHRY